MLGQLCNNSIDVSNYFYVPYTIHLFCPKVCFTTCTLIVWRFSEYFWHNSCKCYSKHTDCELAWCILCQGNGDSTDYRVVTLLRQKGRLYGLGINCNTSHEIIFMQNIIDGKGEQHFMTVGETSNESFCEASLGRLSIQCLLGDFYL